MGAVVTCAVVVAWVTAQEREKFERHWNLETIPEWLIFQHDVNREGCGVTKNKGIRRAVDEGYETVVVLDGDCFPSNETPTLEWLMHQHVKALEPQHVMLYQTVTDPPSRGTPYGEVTMEIPIAASMGFWTGVPDYCAVRQLAFNAKPMVFDRSTVYHRYFPLCGMNVAFKPREWWPWCQFIDVSRYDDIWMGWLWQREAYRRGYGFNLNGPLVHHSRQSNVWKNLIDEAKYAHDTETLWRVIAAHPTGTYADLVSLLPTGWNDLDMKEMEPRT